MSKYTTGELAKLCSVSVRTVQYYDQKDLLNPSELTEGGRRLYSDNDLIRLRQICLFKSLGLSLKAIKDILNSNEPISFLILMLNEQEKQLKQEIENQHRQIEIIDAIKENISNYKAISLESINDIENIMNKNKKLRKFRIMMLITAMFMAVIEVISILLLILKGQWIVFIVGIITVFAVGAILTAVYYKKVDYICPECGTVFKPHFWKFFFAGHTPKTRKLKCTHCKKKNYCVETFSD